MPRLVLSLDGACCARSTSPKNARPSARRSHNDLVIDNLAVTASMPSCSSMVPMCISRISDRQRTTVNGQPVRSTLLQSGDVVEIGKYPAQVPGRRAAADSEVDIDTSQPLRREFYGPGPATIQVRQPGASEDAGQPAVATIRSSPVPTVDVAARPP